MAYTPTTWVNNVTALNATRMNNLESGVDATDQALTDHLADTTDAHDASAISVADAGTFYTATDVEGVLAEIAPQLAAVSSYVLVQDQKTQNTAGGTFTSGAWQTRVLNTEVNDADGICSLSSNQITLSAGTYRCFIRCPASFVDRHQARLQNVTDATTILLGTSENLQASTVSNNSASVIVGEFTIAASKALEVQHRCQTTNATNGFGVPANFGTEVFTLAEFWKVS